MTRMSEANATFESIETCMGFWFFFQRGKRPSIKLV